ncbi:MAG TPA: peroxiredoxin-like family protein [Thermoguttaceae bacterium]|nr:peroxiredoxin-like family protein [Thermoguttaceae bacterium]HPP51433.1 peroxiredoxin-like family protein [Thermoguttaceae bacterium]
MQPADVGQQAPDVLVRDTEGQEVRLSTLWKDHPAVLFFLRHLGCPCTGEQAAAIQQDAPRFQAAGARVAAITLGPAEAAAKLFTPSEASVLILVDAEQQAYQAYGLGRGGFWQLAGPPVWSTALKAILRGRVGRPSGDVRQLAGAFLVDRQGVIRYAHRASHSADFPDHEAILAELTERTDSRSPESA